MVGGGGPICENPCRLARRCHIAVFAVFPGTSFSETTVNKKLAGHVYTLKVAQRVPMERNTVRALQARREFVEQLLALQAEGYDLAVHSNKCGYNAWTRRRYARSRRGTRAPLLYSSSRGRYVTVQLALSLEGLLHYKVLFVSTNTTNFTSFFAGCTQKAAESYPGRKVLFVMIT